MSEPQWLRRFESKGVWAPFWLGLAIATGFLLARCAIDGFYLATVGLPVSYDPLWRSATWWTEVVNAIQLGFVPAALVISRRGIGRDLTLLRTWLPGSEAEFGAILNAATDTGGLARRAFRFSGLVVGIVLVLTDPSISLQLGQSISNPAFVWPLIRVPILSWLLFIFIDADLKATRTYFHVGQNLIKADLLDVQSLSPFAQRGLRSALMWVIFSMLLSLFWLGEDTASSINFSVLLAMLTTATVAFVVPLLGVHRNILALKRAELDRLRDEIRVERAAVTESALSVRAASPRLANLIAYHQLIVRVREWPIDFANLLRFFLYLFIGLGSWLGGAIVERLLDSTLGG
jgi:hypothetical protein